MIQVFCALVVCFGLCASSYRPLDEGEGRAFQDVWGVRDVETLMRIQRDLHAYWNEREEFLFNGPCQVLTHRAFCQRYVREAKEFIRKTAKLDSALWFKDIECVDSKIKEYFAEDSDMFLHAQCTFFAIACDHTHRPRYENMDVVKKDMFEGALKICAQDSKMKESVEEWNKRLRWTITPNGAFSMFDYLVVRRKKYYLCSALSNPEDRATAYWHQGQFLGWSGAYDHDVAAHASSNIFFDSFLSKHNVSYQEYFDDCCNPAALSCGDIVAMSQKAIGLFCQFHEMTSVQDCDEMDGADLFPLIFPKSENLTDAGLRDIVPYFMDVPLGHNWLEEPLKRKLPCYDHSMHRAIDGWIALHCFSGLRFLRQSDCTQYFRSLREILAYVPDSDMARCPDFVDNVLEILHKMGRLQAPDVPLCVFVQEAKRQAKKCVEELTSMKEKMKTRRWKIRAPYQVQAVIFVEYREALSQMSSRGIVFCAPDRDGSVRVFMQDSNTQPCFDTFETGHDICVLKIASAHAVPVSWIDVCAAPQL